MRPEALLTSTPAGLCCPLGGFHIDPLRAVEKALVTHAHSDHARPGHRCVLATRETLDLMRLRYGDGFAGSTQAIAYGETVRLGDVAVSFHPAGHVLGSAQIRVEANGLRIVASGDYKDVGDPTCAAFAPLSCDVFITEATFGLPVFRHGDPAGELAKLLRSLALFPERAHLVGVYALGKAQRLIALLRAAGYDRPIYLHGAIEPITRYYAQRFDLGELRLVREARKAEFAGAVALCPPSALKDLWTRRFPDPIACFASGWMRVRARARQRGIELPLVISDHCDWEGLTRTIPATGASEVWVTHGAEEALVRWCATRGLCARPLHLVGYGEEEPDEQTLFPGAQLDTEALVVREQMHERPPSLRGGPGGDRLAGTVRLEPGEVDRNTTSAGADCSSPALADAQSTSPPRREVSSTSPCDESASSPALADARSTSPPRGERIATPRVAGTQAFAELLDRLAYEHGRNAKLRLMTEFFRATPDPERGWALAALTGALSFPHAKPGLIRALIMERADPDLFVLSYDYVGDLSETVALMWPSPPLPLRERARAVARDEGSDAAGSEETPHPAPSAPPSPTRGEGSREPAEHPPTLAEVVTTLATLGKAELPGRLVRWLDALDETGRWALLKLVTGGLRIGVSARLAKTAVAALGDRASDEIEILWPALAPPYADLFAWVEGRSDKPLIADPAPFRPPMLSHAIAATDFVKLDPAEYLAEWKWDGVRVQAVAGARADGQRVARLYSRTGEDISRAFPDLVETFTFDGALDGELLIRRDGAVQSFAVLQQRLNRKTVTAQLMAEFPAHLRAYDLLVEDDVDLRVRPLAERRRRLKGFLDRLASPRIDLSPRIPFADWDALAEARADPAAAGAGIDADAIEGVMLKRCDAPYLPGRPKGPWWKWKRDPFVVDAVLLYAQRGHGKRSSFYSDYTFGLWTGGEQGDALVPVGKAYFGFTDAELAEIDRFIRRNTINRFGPVREVAHERDRGLVFEVAFEGLQRSTRHRSGVAMRFPRISRLRFDKQPADADRLETLLRMLEAAERTPASGGRVVESKLARTRRRKGG